MAMIKQRCSDCGKVCWHNSLPKKEGKAGAISGYRCTYCGSPLGTGPKRERNSDLNRKQIAKARAEMSPVRT